MAKWRVTEIEGGRLYEARVGACQLRTLRPHSVLPRVWLWLTRCGTQQRRGTAVSGIDAKRRALQAATELRAQQTQALEFDGEQLRELSRWANVEPDPRKLRW